MKKLFFTLNFVALSIFFVSCSKTDSGLESANTTTANGLKASTENNRNLTGRESDVAPVIVCAPKVVTLFAGQTSDAGNVTVRNDADYIYVTYNTTNGYVLSETHLFVGDCALIPVNRPGNPIPGQFPYTSTHNNLTSYTYQIPIMAISLSSCGCIAAHAVVKKYNEAGQVIDQQTAWGNGTVINPTGQWGMKFDYCSCL